LNIDPKDIQDYIQLNKYLEGEELKANMLKLELNLEIVNDLFEILEDSQQDIDDE
jgi:hypothetical protein